jgi:nitrite reductase/ring-hydroxylating ferredoxin subunit
MRFYALEKLINLRAGYRREFRIDTHRLLLLQEHDELYLVEALCPHQQHPLTAASVTGHSLRCPLHGYQFSLQSGRVLQATNEDCRPLQIWPLVYEGADVGIFLDDDSGNEL